MTLRRGLPVKNGATDADDTRWDLNALVLCDAAGLPRAGVTSPVGATLVASTSTMNVAVAAFQGVAVRDGGTVLLANDAPTNVPIEAAPAANSRLDVVYAKQNDSSSTVSVPDGDDLPVFGVLKGVAAASPVRNPAGLPAGALELATVLVPSTATATNSSGVVITQTAQFTCGAGGLVPFRTATARDAVTTLRPGTYGQVIADGTEYVWDGTVWQSLPAAAVLSFNGAATSLPNGTSVQMTDTMLVTSEATGMTVAGGAVTILASGKYWVGAQAQFVANGTGIRQIQINKNSTSSATNLLVQAVTAGTSAGATAVGCRRLVTLSAGDVVRAFIAQNSGGSLGIDTSAQALPATYFEVVKA